MLNSAHVKYCMVGQSLLHRTLFKKLAGSDLYKLYIVTFDSLNITHAILPDT